MSITHFCFSRVGSHFHPDVVVAIHNAPLKFILQTFQFFLHIILGPVQWDRTLFHAFLDPFQRRVSIVATTGSASMHVGLHNKDLLTRRFLLIFKTYLHFPQVLQIQFVYHCGHFLFDSLPLLLDHFGGLFGVFC